ncbi:RNA polymerase sigma factor [Butyrivibrio sp. WCD2001]|uniref:RNA polymerase sigma factor n=1 Tax=Butyrivibrio sp. WCD2001 TaxID=1280681 RepID=UPI0004185EB6|nr:sigma-70 family RNA polymerase sigma factor [Butyrivibrio sp. WCD2001]
MDESLKKAIEEMAKGKEEGFNAVYSATYNHVYFRAKAYMKDEADAQDLTQIVYIEAYKNIKSLQNTESLFGWLDGICHNQGMKLFRKKKDVLPNVDEEGKDIFETLESNDLASLPELSTDQKETSRIIQEFIDELPEVQKAAVIAYYFDGFSVGEIAQMQNCSEGTVKSRLNYARKFLKEKVEGTEKRDGIRLHAVALPTIWYAIKLMSENTKLSAKAAGGIYVGSCAEVGLAPTAITLGNAGAGISAKMVTTGAGTIAATTSGAGAAAGTAGAIGATGAAVATGTGLSMGIKALIIAGAVLIGGGTGAGVTYVAVNNNHENEAEIVAEADESEIGNTLDTKEGNDESEDNRDEMPITDEKEPDNSSLPGLQEQLVATGTVIRNQDISEYREKLEEHEKKYGQSWMNEYGIRFTEPVKLLVDGDVVEINEAWILPYTSLEDLDFNEFVGKTITAEGWIGTHVNSKKISEDVYQSTDTGIYSYRPNGEYEFMIDKLIDSTENPEAKNEEEIALTDDEKIQIVDAIAYFDYNNVLTYNHYVRSARCYALAMHIRTSDKEKAFPWSKTDILTKELITDIWKAFGVTIPSDYDFNDDGITPDSDFPGELELIDFNYGSLDVVNNGDGTYTLNGTYKISIESEPAETYPFTATAVKGGNPDIFGGLIITEIESSDSNEENDTTLYEKFLHNEERVHINTENDLGYYFSFKNFTKQDYTLDEMVDTIIAFYKEDWMTDRVSLEKIEYTYIDCGNDGDKELAVVIHTPSEEPLESWEEYLIIKNINGTLQTVYSDVAWTRNIINLNEYGYIDIYGDGGVENSGWDKSFIDAEGKRHDVENAEDLTEDIKNGKSVEWQILD